MRVYFSTDKNFACVEDGNVKEFDSAYINRLKSSLEKMTESAKWKTSGTSAKFQGIYSEDSVQTPSFNDASVFYSGVSPMDENRMIYSVYAQDNSGIFIKNNDGNESHLIHSSNQVFLNPEYRPEKDKILVSVKTRNGADIGTFDIKTNDLRILTSGSSVDAYPSYSRFNDLIYFSSSGLTQNGQKDCASVYCLKEDLSKFEEVLSEKGFDLLMPKTDKKGNLYYIKKPFKGAKTVSLSFLDILLFPFRLIYGFFKGLYFLSMLSTKSSRKKLNSTSGNNPAKDIEKSERELFIFDQQINMEKEEKANAKKSETAGFAPEAFALYKVGADGKSEKVKGGVLSYCIDDDNNIIYTNGKYIIKINQDGSEAVLHKGKKIFFVSTLVSNPASGGIFD